MSNFDLATIVKEKWYIVLFASFIVGATSFILSTFLTPEYKTSVDLLVIQKQPTDRVDAFGAAKSAEYLSSILNKAIYSSSFYNTVLDSTEGVSKRAYGSTPTEIAKAWDKQVDSKVVGETGIIHIEVYNSSLKASNKLAQAIASNLINNAGQYHGGGDNVEVKILDDPKASPKPARPNLLINTLLGALVGIGVSIVLLSLSYNEMVVNDSKVGFLGDRVVSRKPIIAGATV
ncbi:hypothetical protein COY23_00370 [bacterium (Candidatus Torokbacteria) CG_4_10_14_0_2_um_filter_35_8]|nr:MAG: hypothetical protein COY23_00370 [bacterium (Candidatus Torokbacteria) CG_4_10_14_0_2_um_filter_35_8]